ncbi:hypothetical protein IC232_29650 [Microvirga sp. BT688]|uniref:hypothetical protein n=1 Tax=Microvirga sp. TaxID=1873136 RepID=UPI001685272C|nr:hypothetical protein [Microvirga sp.]MBD2750808.1 hypothetical protein [Microvirga sp.]
MVRLYAGPVPAGEEGRVDRSGERARARGRPELWLPVLVVVVNVMAGVVSGWLFWRAGLEAGILAHSFAHVTAAVIWTVVSV